MTVIDLELVRSMSLANAERLGYSTNRSLPLLDEGLRLRSFGEITSRALCLFAAIATAYGFPKIQASDWLKANHLSESPSRKEAHHLGSVSKDYEPVLQSQIGGLWALAWMTGIADDFDFGRDSPPSLVSRFPDIKVGESTAGFLQKAALRNIDEIIAQCDLAYCLHWAIRDAMLRGMRPPGKIHPMYIVERRRAFEWALGDDDWDDVSLDT